MHVPVLIVVVVGNVVAENGKTVLAIVSITPHPSYGVPVGLQGLDHS